MDPLQKDAILEAVDIVELIGESVALKRKGKDYMGLCPFHPDRNPSMAVSPSKQIFKCWSCGAGGDAIRFVQLRQKLSFPEALELLAKRAGIEFRRGSSDGRQREAREQLTSVMQWAVGYFRRNLLDPESGRAARDYAARRGLTDETCERFKLGLALGGWDELFVAANHVGIAPELLLSAGLVAANDRGGCYDRFRSRLMFPISDSLGRPVAFGGRTLVDDKAKYLNSPETPLFSKSRILFGLDLARRAIIDRREAVVVEGYLDAVLLAQAGFEHSVATLGTALTDLHVRQLKNIAPTITLCFDGDAPGLKAADRALEIALRSRSEVRVTVLEGGLDPADYVLERGAEAFSAALQSAVPALEFKWKVTEEATRGQGPRARRAAAEELLAFVARVAGEGGVDPIEQGLLVSRLSDLIALPADTVYGLLRRAMSTVGSRSAETATEVRARSTYEESIDGLPPGLVATVEELIGCVLVDSALVGRIAPAFREAVETCDPWRRLFATFADLSDRVGDFTREDVLATCEDSDLIELVSRSSARVDDGGDVAVAMTAGVERLSAELAAMGMTTLRGRLKSLDPASSESDQALRSFFDMARRQQRSFASGPDGGSSAEARRQPA